jgi:hypothetical protein
MVSDMGRTTGFTDSEAGAIAGLAFGVAAGLTVEELDEASGVDTAGEPDGDDSGVTEGAAG